MSNQSTIPTNQAQMTDQETDREKFERMAAELLEHYRKLYNLNTTDKAQELHQKAIADAIERAVAEAVTEQADEGARALLDQQRILSAEWQAEIDRLKAELERVTGRESELTDRLDMALDEFVRISHLTDNTEINGLCTRGVTVIKQTVPVIEQRDTAEKERDTLRAQIEEACGVLDEMLASATPKQVEHSAMFYAWQDARAFLQKARPQ